MGYIQRTIKSAAARTNYCYGVLIDHHAPREDRGVPVLYWDGWYQSKALAIEVLELLRQRHPYAHIWLIRQEDDWE